ncbi:MAG: tRNA guanosine(34) transglycosylase Tgt, partial [Verrucomicrobia bacterium]|nr:tRNA guanosine(34) transglycosylase Tgt [Verrucomicrobiota bacterium]
MSRLNFTLENEAPGSKARAAHFQTLHGAVQTPVFMPVGTQATVKSQTVETLKETGASVLLANTYHLLLRPGAEVFRKFGGIHRFMNWDRPVLTDSGGFQIFSLPGERAMKEEGARFRSYVDGDVHLLSPESSIAMQKVIGSDIMMALDQCIPSTAPHDEAEAAMELTHRWARRSLEARGDSPQALFGIVQGACHHDLRKKSAAFLRQLPFDGLAIGGLAVGETHAERYEFTGLVTDHLPKTLPRYLMGVGTPIDILEAVHRGVDMFDCIIPSQLAQRGVAFTANGRLQVRRTVNKLSEAPLEAGCPCSTCRTYTRAYLHHLVKSDEMLGWHLLGVHNFSFYHRLMRDIRESILENRFMALYEEKRHRIGGSDDEDVVHPVKKRAPPKSRQLGDYDVVTGPQGFSSIRQVSSGEVMHSVNAPREEANALYIEQSQLATRLLKRDDDANELVIWDVGLGAASNAMAALECFEKTLATHGAEAIRPLRLVSFEIDLDPLRLALRFASHFPHLRHGAPHAILKIGHWDHASDLMHWKLHHGDFLAFLESSPVPDLIFFDPFSAKTDTGLWTPAVFTRLFHHCRPKSTELYTYSAATAVRVALLGSGFYVAEGVGTGPKSTTTVAFTHEPGAAKHPAAPRLLAAEWLARWQRSDSKFPASLPIEARAEFER